MRIAHVAPTYPPYRGGVGHVVSEYAVRLQRRGHDVQVFTPRYGVHMHDPPFVHRLTALPRCGNAAFVPALAGLAGFDLIHLHYPFFGGAEPILWRAWFRAGERLVLSYHFDATASGVRGAAFRLHQRAFLPQIVARADRILVSSEDYCAHSALARFGNLDERIEVHPYGVDLERFQPGDDARSQQQTGNVKPDVSLLFVGRLDAAHHFKGIDVLLDALPRVKTSGVHVTIVGDGPLRAGIEADAAARGLAGRISFAGDVSDTSLPLYYRAADIHVFPSTAAAEAFGLVCVEAAASGIPSIASDLPGVRTVVLNEETGLLVPPGDPDALAGAIDRLAGQPSLRRLLGAQARASAESRFAWEPLISRLEETYHRTIQARPR